MTVDAALLEVLQCPSCQGHLNDNQSVLLCDSCGKQFPVFEGIPDLTFFRSGSEQDDFNQAQASYEAALHDRAAESAYEEQIIRVYGTKTRLVAQKWADRLKRLSPSVRVLDYGCGTGQLSRVLGQHCRPLFAFDISAACARKNVAENGVLGCVANALFLPFKERAFDVVCMSGVLHHIMDLPQAIAEISRVTKSFVFVSDIIPHSWPKLRRILAYPGFSLKLLYGSWTVVSIAYGIARKLGRTIETGCSLSKPADAGPMSKYERPIASETVETLFRDAGFSRERLQYWTNLDYPGNGLVKRLATMALVNETIGTHFDLELRRNQGNP